MPRVFSSFDKADDECARCSISPLTTVPLHEPQAPFLQPYGRPMPWRRAALEHRFVLFYLKLPAALPERDVKCHKVFEIEKVGNRYRTCRVNGAVPAARDGYNASTMKATRNFRRPRVLIVGCGDVGMRCVPLLRPRAHVFALTSHAGRCAELRAAGVTPLVGDLDVRRSLKRLAGLAPTVLHLAPPQKTGDDDRRTRALLATLGARRDSARAAVAPAVSPVGRLRQLRASWAESGTADIVPDGVRRTAAFARTGATRVREHDGRLWRLRRRVDRRDTRDASSQCARQAPCLGRTAIAARDRARQRRGEHRADSGHLCGQPPAARAARKALRRP